MNARSVIDLYQLARDFLDQYEDDDAWPLFRDEANARFNAEDDGDHADYAAEAVEIFKEAKLDAFTDAGVS